jgi:hypothetical protein
MPWNGPIQQFGEIVRNALASCGVNCQEPGQTVERGEEFLRVGGPNWHGCGGSKEGMTFWVALSTDDLRTLRRQARPIDPNRVAGIPGGTVGDRDWWMDADMNLDPLVFQLDEASQLQRLTEIICEFVGRCRQYR